MDLSDAQRTYLCRARVGRLATADAEGRPNVVPVCFALVDGTVVTPVDEKPKAATPSELRRMRDVAANPYVALVVDEYAEDWSELRWLQIRGTATVLDSGDDDHGGAVAALREKYPQYQDHALEDRPILRIEPGHALTWSTAEDRALE